MSKLRAGDWVEVLSKEEILRTLDQRAGWMACRSCRRCFNIADSGFKVFQRAHKTCDTIV